MCRLLYHFRNCIVKFAILFSCISLLTRGTSRRSFAVTASAFQNRLSFTTKHSGSGTASGPATFNSNLFSSTSNMVDSPPKPRREEDKVVYAGVAPDGWDMKVPRQANESSEKLLDPPVPINGTCHLIRIQSN
jgi:hypothetical protein